MKNKRNHLLGLIFSGASCIALIWLFNNVQQIGTTSIPPLGKFLSPNSGFWANAEQTHEGETQSLSLEGTSAAVTVEFDERLVPHIFASSTKDAYQVMGYLHAQNRLFQMDLVSRNASGRLAEILGPRLLKRDKEQRRKGLLYGAQKAVEVWRSSKNFDLLEAYGKGYNQYLKNLDPSDYPIEFKLLDYEPEPWTALRSALLLKNMAQTLCSRNDDIKATNTYNWLGKDLFDELFPEQMINEDPIIPSSVKYPFEALLPEVSKPEVPKEMIGSIPFENPPLGIGSNNWAISGQKSKSGAPILANDPHLSLTLPSIWYETHLITPESNVYGVSLPGFPSIVIGFNEHIAWGLTNVGHDLTDWYEVDWTSPKKDRYWLDGQEKEVEYRIEVYKIKGGSEDLDTVRYTHWGPVFFDKPNNELPDLAMHWIAHEKPLPGDFDNLFKLNHATNFDEYRTATQNFQAPPQNIAFISKKGDIALRVQGRFPIKKNGQGKFINNGSSSKNGWKGWIPKDQTPEVLNPERQFISSANQRSTAKDYPYYYNGNFEQFRGRILNRKLEQMQNATVEDMQKLQQDNYSLKAEECLGTMLEQLDVSTLEENQLKEMEVLKKWDYEYIKDSRAAALFEIWMKKLTSNTWDEFQSKRATLPVIFPKSWRLIDLIKTKPEHPYFDIQATPEKEQAKQVIHQSFLEMIAAVKEFEDEKELTWRNYSPVSIPHLTRLPAFGVTDVAIHGCADALNAMRGNFGPSWRMVVEHGKEVNAYGVYPGGQSGNPGSPYYQTGIAPWAAGKYFDLEFVKKPGQLKNKILELNFN